MTKIDIVVDMNPTQQIHGIPGWSSPVGENPAEVAERERRSDAAARRDAARHAQWQARHDEWLVENERRKAEARQANIDAGVARFKSEKRAACLAVGMSEADFDREFPQMLRAAQLQAASSGGQEVERMRASGKYSM